MCLEAVKQNGFAIKYIDKPTEEICLEAVKKNGFAIKYIDKLTEEMCMQSIKQNGTSIKYIKNTTEEMCLEAVKRDGRAIQYIKNPTKEMCLEIKQNPWSILYIENPTEEMCLKVLKENGNIINCIPKKNQSFDIIKAFFDYDWSKSKYSRENYYEYLTKKFITKNQAMIMIEDDPENINLVSRNIQEELVKIKPELENYLNKEESINDFFK